jgi:hypothetical protein
MKNFSRVKYIKAVWVSAPLSAKLSCSMVWIGSILFYNCDVAAVKSISIIAAVCGGFFVASVPRNTVYSRILIQIAVGGLILGFVILVLRNAL